MYIYIFIFFGQKYLHTSVSYAWIMQLNASFHVFSIDDVSQKKKIYKQVEERGKKICR